MNLNTLFYWLIWCYLRIASKDIAQRNKLKMCVKTISLRNELILSCRDSNFRAIIHLAEQVPNKYSPLTR